MLKIDINSLQFACSAASGHESMLGNGGNLEDLLDFVWYFDLFGPKTWLWLWVACQCSFFRRWWRLPQRQDLCSCGCGVLPYCHEMIDDLDCGAWVRMALISSLYHILYCKTWPYSQHIWYESKFPFSRVWRIERYFQSIETEREREREREAVSVSSRFCSWGQGQHKWIQREFHLFVGFSARFSGYGCFMCILLHACHVRDVGAGNGVCVDKITRSWCSALNLVAINPHRGVRPDRCFTLIYQLCAR